MSKTVLFVDSKVEDYQTLLVDLSSDVEVHLLNATEDGVLQIADFLKGRTGLDSIQILSHGSSGALALGSGVLNGDNLGSYKNALSQIDSSLSDNGDILLYGCNVAQGDAGLSFINQLGILTGADIAASDDLTGNAAQGGDWILEFSTGYINANSLEFSASYRYTLPGIGGGYNNVPGTEAAETLTGTNGSDLINGFGGDDTLYGLNSEFLQGDQLDGGEGSDTMIGGLGNHTYYVDNIGDVVIEILESGGGNDWVKSYIAYTLPDGVENLFLLNGTSGFGNQLNNEIHGNTETNILKGYIGSDRLYGDSGIDTALYSGIVSGYEIKYFVDEDGYEVFQITDTNLTNGDEGVDYLYDIEKLQFSDVILDTATLIKPDLGVSSITYHLANLPLWQGERLSFDYLVENTGTGNALPSQSGIYVDGHKLSNLNGEGWDVINAILAGGSFSASNSFSTSNLSAGQHTLTVKADDLGTVSETSDDNNSLSMSFTVKALPTITGIFQQQGYYTTFGDLSKAAYHLSAGEFLAPGQEIGLGTYTSVGGGNFVKPYADTAWDSVQMNWKVLQSYELGGQTSGSYEFSSGLVGHTANWTIGDDGIYYGNNAAGFAVRCNDAVVISFRGTNDNDTAASWTDHVGGGRSPDETDWYGMDNHYSELQYFINQVDAYVRANNITQVYATGHSLGGGMALGYMLKHQPNANTTNNGSIINYEAVTFAAPGYDAITSTDNRVMTIEVDGDPVPDLKAKNGRIVSADVAGLVHLAGTDNGNNYSGSDYHSMDLYLEVAKAFDAELPNTSILNANNIHGFSSNMFSNLDNGLEVTLRGTENYGLPVDNYTWKTEQAPHFALMQANDTLTETNNFGHTDYFIAGAGNDSLIGNDSPNHLLGGADNDVLNGGGANDVLDGGAGDADIAVFSEARSTALIIYSADINTYTVTTNSGGTDTITNVESFSFDGQIIRASETISVADIDTDWLYAKYSDFRTTFGSNTTAAIQYYTETGYAQGMTTSNAGNDILTGGGATDRLYAGSGKDWIMAGAGNDYVDAGDDNDEIVGGDGAGDDTYIGGTGVDKIKYTSAITGILVNLALGTANGNEIGSDLLSFIENIIGGQSDDTLTGNDNANTIRGYTGNDTINGGAGNDILFGESGDDVEIGGDSDDILWGISGNNTLDGGSGNDQLISGEGYNILTGGAGTDSFLFSSATHSTITDFNSTDDLIQLEKNVFSNLKTLGTLDITNFVIGSSALDENDYVIYNSITGELFYDADGNGVQTPIQLATLSTNLALTNNNFVITDTNVGNDTMIGGIGKDILKGGFGNDTINAKAGNDVLIGGAGQDNLTGGLGADKFKFNNILETGITETTRDTIIDFKTTQADKIDLSAIHANLALTENSAFLIFNQGSAFSGSFSATAELFFDQTTQILWGNNNDDLAADFSILLTGVSSLALSDFIL